MTDGTLSLIPDPSPTPALDAVIAFLPYILMVPAFLVSVRLVARMPLPSLGKRRAYSGLVCLVGYFICTRVATPVLIVLMHTNWSHAAIRWATLGMNAVAYCLLALGIVLLVRAAQAAGVTPNTSLERTREG
jgi:hypothetical protein